jgi:hypothetical protein
MARILRANVGRTPPFNSCAGDIEEIGGVEDEFIFEGTAAQFQPRRGGREYSFDGKWEIEAKSEAPYRTRMIVWRPADPTAFNGTVLVLWNNVSSGVDVCGTLPRTPPLVADGFAVVGVSVQEAGVRGPVMVSPAEMPGISIPPPPPALKAHDPARYGDLDHPGDGYSYDIFTQAAELLRSGDSDGIDPLDGLQGRRLVAMGASQSANRLATYLNAIEPVSKSFDGYLLVVYAGVGCHLDASRVPNPPESPYDIAHLLPWRSHVLRSDFEVPVLVVNSETEAGQCYPNSNPDTEYMRWWEFAGAAHSGVADLEEIGIMMGLGGCSVSFAPAWRGAIHTMQRWLDGEVPRQQPRLVPSGDVPTFDRDEHGNAVGGIRLPDLEAPLGTHIGQSASEGLLNMFGSSTPFSPEKVRTLYPSRDVWFDRYKTALDQLVDTEVFLPDDAADVLARVSALEYPG